MNVKEPENQSLYNFLSKGKICDYKKGEIILRAAEVPQGVYFIQRGHVKVYSLTERGDENLHIIYKEGEFFPLIWMFKDILRNVFYEAVDNVRVWRVSRDELIARTQEDVAVANSLLRQTVEQFYVYADRIDNLEYTSAYERVVYRILFLASRFGSRSEGKVRFEIPLTHQQIASSINLARETVSREIEKLESQNLISFKNQRLILNDIAKLEAEIGEPVSLDLWGLK